MGRRAVAFVLGLAAFGVAATPHGGAAGGGGLPVAVAQAEETAESCLSFKKGDLERGISFDIESSCGMKLACKVSWVVQCSDNDGKVESRSAQVERFGLAGSESHRVEMSGSACKQAWRVDDVKWGCDPVKK